MSFKARGLVTGNRMFKSKDRRNKKTKTKQKKTQIKTIQEIVMMETILPEIKRVVNDKKNLQVIVLFYINNIVEKYI